MVTTNSIFDFLWINGNEVLVLLQLKSRVYVVVIFHFLFFVPADEIRWGYKIGRRPYVRPIVIISKGFSSIYFKRFSALWPNIWTHGGLEWVESEALR